MVAPADICSSEERVDVIADARSSDGLAVWKGFGRHPGVCPEERSFKEGACRGRGGGLGCRRIFGQRGWQRAWRNGFWRCW